MRIPVFAATAFLFFLGILTPANAYKGLETTLTIAEDYSASEAYDNGFARGVMRDSEGMRLFDMELVQDDAPGSGPSEKGPYSEPLYGSITVRKDLWLADTRSNGAWMVFFSLQVGSKPLVITVNGHRVTYHPKTFDKKPGNSCPSHWFPIDPAWLVKGRNEVILSCPEGTKPEAWVIPIARKDEFENGGGDPSKAGLNSYRSGDNGRKWKRDALGENGTIKGEYLVRLSLDRYKSDGWVASPVIDLWRGPKDGFLIPMAIIHEVKLSAEGQIPEGASLSWQVRSGAGPDPGAAYWSEYKTVGTGAACTATLGDPGGRYLQWRAELKTTDPRVSPVVRAVKVERRITRVDRLPDNIYILKAENPEIRYSSLYGDYERWDEPGLAKLRAREQLDKVVAGSRTQFEKMVRLCDHIAKRWTWVLPVRQYPAWDANVILDRIDKEGGGGMCIQFSIALIQALEAYGMQGRLVNCVSHELVEVWCDDFGKWVMLDPMQGSNVYNYSKQTGEPLGFEELHHAYLDLYYPDRAIDWLHDDIPYQKTPPDSPVGVGTFDKNWPRSSANDSLFFGIANAAFMRIQTRNDWMGHHAPEPLGHGGFNQSWTAYINWYDAKTPRMRNHELFTDRPADYWPTLNRVKMHAVTGPENDRIFLRFETFCPNFDTYLVQVDEGEWEPAEEQFSWVLHSGRNKLRVRTVNKLGARGKPSVLEVNLADRPNLREREVIY